MPRSNIVPFSAHIGTRKQGRYTLPLCGLSLGSAVGIDHQIAEQLVFKAGIKVGFDVISPVLDLLS